MRASCPLVGPCVGRRQCVQCPCPLRKHRYAIRKQPSNHNQASNQPTWVNLNVGHRAMAANVQRWLSDWPEAWRTGAAAMGDAPAPGPEDETASAPLRGRLSTPGPGGSGLTCTVCGIPAFASVDTQRAHFHLDWHRFNARRALRGQPAVSEPDFDALDDSGMPLHTAARCPNALLVLTNHLGVCLYVSVSHDRRLEPVWLRHGQ